MAPINATYRALKGIIDRGQEGVAYGNKSRLRFLSEAMKQFDGPWFEKGEAVTLPVKTNITRGSLPIIDLLRCNDDGISVELSMGNVEQFQTLGDIATALLANNSFLKEGDQLTFVHGSKNGCSVLSLLLDPTDTTPVVSYESQEGYLYVYLGSNIDTNTEFACAILSREGESGQHLRSTTALTLSTAAAADTHYTSTAKDAAIESYMAANGNTDWPEEQL